MVEQATRERVDAFWSTTLGSSAADLHAPGVRISPNRLARESWRGIYVFGFEGVTVNVPIDMLELIRAEVIGHDAESLLEPKTWLEILGDQARSAWGPVKHYYRDRLDGLDRLAAGRRLNPRDAEAIAALRSALPFYEWGVTGFTAQTAMLFGIFEGDKLVAAANLTPGPDAATDVGFVIHPDARGRGYGTQIAALAARQAILMHGVARYRTLTSSPSTMAIADKLGFEEYGRNVVIYLNDSLMMMA
jgi:GNAT superfamily N-acetyltransferase